MLKPHDVPNLPGLLRQAGRGQAYWLILCASPMIVIVGNAVGILLTHSLWGGLTGIAIAGAAATAWAQMTADGLLLSLARRTSPGDAHSRQIELRLDFNPEHLAYMAACVTQYVPWRQIDDLKRSWGSRVFLAPGIALRIPRRFFANEDAEKVFVAEALKRMTRHGQQRSCEAIVFAGCEDILEKDR